MIHVETYIDHPTLSGWAPLPRFFETFEAAYVFAKEKTEETGEPHRITEKGKPAVTLHK
jgi:hypothetical protein